MRNTLAVFLVLFTAAAQAAGPTDSELTKRVKGSLSATIGVPARDIRVVVTDGLVSLNGRVASTAARGAAEIAAGRTPGVRGVSNNLSVGAGS